MLSIARRGASHGRAARAAILALVALATSAHAQERELVKESFASGKPRVEREVVRTGETLVNDGAYKRWHESGELAAQGTFASGAMSGEWRTFHENGKPRTKGSYNKGRRFGKWELFWDDGKKAGEGSYLLGLRDDRWLYWDREGAKDEAESGLYRMKAELYEDRARKSVVETRNGVRHGRWVSWWENGALQLEGNFREGVREGGWSLHHLDGSLEPELVTGKYLAGALDPSSADSPPALRASWFPLGIDAHFAIEEETASAPAAIDLTKLPHLARAPGVKPSQRTQIQGWVNLFLAGTDEERSKSQLILVQYGRDAMPEILNELGALDLASNEGHASGTKLVALATSIVHGRGFPWSDAPGADVLEPNRRAVLRWFSWWELVKANDAWWSALGAATEDSGELLSIELFELDAGAASSAPGSGDAARPPSERSGLFESRARARRDRDVGAALDQALAWLAAHQSPDGAWDGDGFPAQCGHIGAGECDGTGEAVHDVGLSGLALLAFMGNGITSSSSPHGDVVARGIAWLVSQQDPETGILGRKSSEFLYDQAIATSALCEALQFEDTPDLRLAAERAVALLLSARNKGLAWRYALPPDGENDTSVTSWMVTALADAKSAGLKVDPEAFDGALAWIERMTLRENGRIGYDSVGSRSSRVTDVNQKYPVDKGEAMTAAGLWCRFLAGQDPTTPVFARHAELLLAKLPEWDPAAFKVDMYYWFHGTNAMARMGERYWNAWSSALKKAALSSQRKEKDSDARGSWDPIDPWGWSGGRIYSTALMALCLEGGWRDPLAKR